MGEQYFLQSVLTDLNIRDFPLQATSFSWLVMRFAILYPYFRRKFGDRTLGLCVLRIIGDERGEGFGARSSDPHQKVDLPHVAP